jgi:hypothetical protein
VALAITILPADDGWTLRSPAVGADMVFLKGGQAEAAGRALAGRLAAAGQDVELEIFLRDGALAGRIPFPAELAA